MLVPSKTVGPTRAASLQFCFREWVLNQARNAVIGTFHQLREARFQHHQNFLQTLPCYTLYFRWNGNPPIDPSHLHILHSQIQQANMQYQQMVDEDWRRSCLRYPEVLDYYLGLVEISLPDGQDTAVREPQFGAAVKERPRVKARKDSGERTSTKEHRKKERRRSRGRTPPPHAPMPGGYR